jgi:hypothetical protein
MAGLLTKKPTPPREEMTDEETQGGEAASPEEQQQYQELFENGWRLIADEKGGVRPAVLKMLDADPSDLKASLGEDALGEYGEQLDPAVALGLTVAQILVREVADMKQKGGQVQAASVWEAGKDLLLDVAQLAQKNGLGPYDQNAMTRAATVAAGAYGVAAKAQGLISDEEIGQDMADMKAADESGQLQQMVGGGEEQAEQAPPEAAPPEAM